MAAVISQSLEIVEFAGMHFHTRPDTNDRLVLQENVCKHPYEKFFPIEKSECWLDIGAHIGSFAARVNSVGGLVCSFEPFPASAELYRLNMQANGFPCYLHEMAVLQNPSSAKLPLYINTRKGNYAGNSVFPRWKRPKPEASVRCVSMDEAITMTRNTLGAHGSFCIKLDAEGVELEILEALDVPEVVKLVWEHHFDVDGSLDRLRAIVARLEKQGFVVYPEQKIPKGPRWTSFRKPHMLLFAKRDI